MRLPSACAAAAAIVLTAPTSAQIKVIQTSDAPPIELGRTSGLGERVEIPVTTGTPAAEVVQSARTQAREALKELGLESGYDPKKDRFVVVGSASIVGDPASPGYGMLRSIAYQEALLDAQRTLTTYLDAAVAVRVERALDAPGAETTGVVAEAGTQIDEVGKMAYEQAAELIESGAAPTPAAAVKTVLARSEFKDAVRVASAAEASALQVYQCYESTPVGSPGAIAIIGIVSPSSRAMAGALLDECKVPDKAPKIPVGEWVRALGSETLLYTHGVLLRRDQNGELNLLAFGQATPEGNVPLLVDAAFEEARLDALQALRNFIGLAVTSDARRSRELNVEAYRADAKRVEQQFSSVRTMQSSVQAIGNLVDISGVFDVHDWRAVHPLAQAADNDSPTIGVVLGWKISSRENVRGLLEAAAKADAEAPAEKPPGKRDGKGAKGDIED